MIKTEKLSKTYQVKNEIISALDDISLNIKQGEIFGIIGRSGAGKSSLLRCLNLLEKPTSGGIAIDGVDLLSLSTSKLRSVQQKIGMIFQHFNLLNSRTVFGNVALPLELAGVDKTKLREKVTSLLNLVGLNDRQDSYPQQLSGGQKQRVAIARALATDPHILLCDEATSALDPETTGAILQLLREIHQQLKITIVMITHEMAVIKKICDRVAVIDEGRIVESGSLIDIFVDPKMDVTKRLTQSVLHIKLPQEINDKLKASFVENSFPIIKLTFVGQSATEPVVVDLQKKFNVAVSIMQSDIEVIGDASVGFMVCQFMGAPAANELALTYLSNLNIKSEVLGYV